MPDTQPITKSFPWLLIGHHRPVYDDTVLRPDLVSDDFLFILTDDAGQLILTPDNPVIGDLYRYI